MKLFQKYIAPYIKQYYRPIILTIFVGFLTVLASSMLTFTSGYLITRASEQPENILLLYVPIVLVRTFGLSQAVTRYLERLNSHNTVLKILAVMRVKLYVMLEPQALFIRSRFKMGDILGTLADDIEHLQEVYVRTIFPTVIGLCVFLFSVTALSLFDWVFALWMAFCLSIIVFVYPIVSLYLSKKRQIDQKQKRGELYQYLTDAVLGLRDWIISGRKENFQIEFKNISNNTNLIDKKIRYWNQSRELQMRVFTGIILIFMGYWASNEVQAGELAPTFIAAFILGTLPILESLIPLSNAVERVPTYQESLRRLHHIDTHISHEPPGENKIFLETQSFDLFAKQLFYKYENGKDYAIKDITFTIQQGQKVAFLGKSGSGKSTLLQLLQGGMIPTSGYLSIGANCPNEYKEDVYNVISVLNQKPYLFATTVENNIRLGNQQATRQEVEQAITMVGLASYISSLPHGIDTQMEEAGQRFSGGERQRIALARILLKNTPIVVLDEPTVGLDPQTENQLIQTIFETLQDKTVIWITHHLIQIEQMDNIIFLDKGEIVMNGAHEELFKNNGRYRQLYEVDRGAI
ncbi:thiol reductant ABC exporter subunit CydC [Fredinandcohnia sp. 179-A 10B2 NHS]|uniref:thiol reductant ABC exporter subunit CydC n=1 Tax=Fredinandcohnia sp. 179-A 10B2 NHS TaxID=3235176 RepID=UPI0039A39BFC